MSNGSAVAATNPERYKRRARPGDLVLHPTEPVILVKLIETVLDLQTLDASGQPTVVSTDNTEKRLNLTQFGPTSDIAKYAANIMKSASKYIHVSKEPVVRDLLTALQARLRAATPTTNAAAPTAAAPATALGSAATAAAAATKAAASAAKTAAPASVRASSSSGAGFSSAAAAAGTSTAASGTGAGGAAVRPDKPTVAKSQPTHSLNTNTAASATGSTPKAAAGAGAGAVPINKLQLSAATTASAAAASTSTASRSVTSQPLSSIAGSSAGSSSSAAATAAASNTAAAGSDEPSLSRAERPKSAKGRKSGTNGANGAGSDAGSGDTKSKPAPAPAPAPTVASVLASTMNKAEIDTLPTYGDFDEHTGGAAMLDTKSNNSRVGPGVNSKSNQPDSKRGAGAGGAGARPGSSKPKPAQKKVVVPKPAKEARMDDVERYQEMLYEDMEHKIEGTGMLLQLIQNEDNLEHFIQNDSLLGALSRILQEERKKNMELATNILEIFFCLSTFSDLHHFLINNKIGDTTMKIVDLELKRYDIKLAEVETKKNDVEVKRKLYHYLKRQDRLLFVCFYILFNLSEDISIELKMKSRKLIRHTVKMMTRISPANKALLPQLQLLVVTFLKKLSIFSENVAEMNEHDILRVMAPFVQPAWVITSTHADLLRCVLRLLYNLSFDSNLKQQMIQAGMIPQFVGIVKTSAAAAQQAIASGQQPTFENSEIRRITINIIYNISMDEKHRNAIDTQLAPAVPLLTQLIIRSEAKLVDRELMAVAINLAHLPKNALLMCGGDGSGLHAMIRRVHALMDPLLIKLVRTISEHGGATRLMFPRYLHELVGLSLKQQHNHDFLVESLAVIANCCLPDVIYADLINKHALLDFLIKQLVPSFADDDVVLQVVMLLGTLATDPKAAQPLSHQRLISNLYGLLEKTKDTEIVLQVLYTLFKFLVHPPTREAITSHQHLVGLILDFVADPSEAVRQLSNQCLDIIMDTDEHGFGWRDRIRQQRFESYNREWLEVTKAQALAHSAASAGGGSPMGSSGSSPQHFGAPQHQQLQYRMDAKSAPAMPAGARLDVKAMAAAQQQHAAAMNRQSAAQYQQQQQHRDMTEQSGEHEDSSSARFGAAPDDGGGAYHAHAHGGPQPYDHDDQPPPSDLDTSDPHGGA